MYNIFDFLLVPASNKMYEGATRLHFIFAGTSKNSKMLYIVWLNVGGHFYNQSITFYYMSIHFTFCNCNKMYGIYNI